MELLKGLQEFGYYVRMEGDKIKLSWQGSEPPDEEEARLFLEAVRQNKEKVRGVLLQEAEQEARAPIE